MGVVPYSRAVIVDLVVDIGRRGEYDTQFDKGRVCGMLEGGNAKFHGRGWPYSLYLHGPAPGENPK